MTTAIAKREGDRAAEDLFSDRTPDLFELLCRRRGWTPEYLAEIEDASHDELLGTEEMVERLHAARTRGEKVVVAPDFDMDGIASGVLGWAGLAELGFDVELHVPNYSRGHDLTPEDIEEIHAAWPDTKVLLTCDGGVNSHRGVAAARAKGWTTLVTDHHEELPPGSTADVTVDPHRLDETYAHPGICGAHVLHQVLSSYVAAHAPEKAWEIRLLRLFAGLGTVSDVMPVLYENRKLVRDSLSLARLLYVYPPKPDDPWSDPDYEAVDVSEATLLKLLALEDHSDALVNALTGFAVVLKAFSEAGKLRDGASSIDEGFYGYYLAPAMNAPRRIGGDLSDCFEVFTAESVEDKLAAARRVIEGNEERKRLVEEHSAELVSADPADQPLAPWVYFSSAPKGMLGLLANRMMHAGGHPVAVVSRPVSTTGAVSGSARAPEWFSVIDALEPEQGLSAIGHQQACGVRAETPDLLDELAQVLQEATALAAAQVDPEERRADLVLGVDEDCDAGVEDTAPLAELVRRTEALRPFGHGFAEPEVEIALDPSDLRVDRIGSEKQHLRLVTRSGLSCLWWNAAEAEYRRLAGVVASASLTEASSLRFAAKLQLNTFRGETRVQAVIRDQYDRA